MGIRPRGSRLVGPLLVVDAHHHFDRPGVPALVETNRDVIFGNSRGRAAAPSPGVEVFRGSSVLVPQRPVFGTVNKALHELARIAERRYSFLYGKRQIGEVSPCGVHHRLLGRGGR